MRFCDFLSQGHSIGNALLNENKKFHEEGVSKKSLLAVSYHPTIQNQKPKEEPNMA